MSRKLNRQALLSITALSIIIVVLSVLSIRVVNASVSFKKSDENWSNVNNKVAASTTDTYPYNTSGITVNSVGMDILYGTTRDLAVYHGEFPYDVIYDGDDNYNSGWEGYFAEDGTTVTDDSNPTFGANSGTSHDDYWGAGVTEDDFANIPTAEKINENNIKSLRLYAASTTKTGILYYLGTVSYVIVKTLASAAVTAIGLIVQAKNLSVDLIMEVLHLDDLNDQLVKNFIYDKGAVRLSAFTLFCLVGLIISVAAFALRYVRGASKTQGLWEIIGTSLLGLLIIGMCLTGRVSSLGSNVADLANVVLYSVAESIGSGGTGKAFEVDITDANNENQILQISEMALVNKAFIDLQICSQFNVSHVEDLNFDKFGDANGAVAKQYLSGVGSADMVSDFNNNLGYYYWFANSSAVNKTSLNAKYPATDTISVTNKLSSMITYLQHQYNNNLNSASKTELITRVVHAFASPGAGGRFLSLILFAIALALLAVVTFKYALNVVIGKVELFLGLLGSVVAGPLILTSNKKLVEAGKAIIGMVVVAFIEITVYSIIFDVIIYMVSAMFAPTIPALFVTIGALVLLYKFNPLIAQRIKMLMERTERTISPALVDGRRAVKNYAKSKAQKAVDNYNNSSKVVGYKADGTEITQSRNGDALSKILAMGNNALFKEGQEHEGLISMNTKLNKTRQQNLHNTERAVRLDAESNIKNELNLMRSDAKKISTEIQNEYNGIVDSTKDVYTDENGNTYEDYIDVNLSEEEKRMVADRRAHIDELHALINNHEYQELLKKEHDIDAHNSATTNPEDRIEMDEEDKAKLFDYKQKIGSKRIITRKEKSNIDNAIEERAARETLSKRGVNFDEIEGKSITDKINKVSELEAMDQHRDQLETTLRTSIEAMEKEVNNTSKNGKIGRDSVATVNKEAAESQAAAMLQLEQLKNNQSISSTDMAKTEVRDIVDNVSRHYDKDKQSNDAKERHAAYSAIDKASTDDERQAAVESYNRLVERQNEARDQKNAEVRGQYENAKADSNAGIFTPPTVSEQLQSAVERRINTSTESKASNNQTQATSNTASQQTNRSDNSNQSSQTQRRVDEARKEIEKHENQTNTTDSSNQRANNTQHTEHRQEPTPVTTRVESPKASDVAHSVKPEPVVMNEPVDRSIDSVSTHHNTTAETVVDDYVADEKRKIQVDGDNRFWSESDKVNKQ